MRRDYRKPTVGGTLGLVLAVVGAAGIFTDYKNETLALVLGAAGAAVLLGAFAWGMLVWTLERGEAEVRGWVRDELAQHAERGQRQEQHSDLRVAVAELLEELEYVEQRVTEDSHDYWAKYTLPAHRWEEHGKLLARHDDEAHAAVRAAYREVDRLNHCIHSGGRTYGPMGDYDESYTVQDCEPERWTQAFEQAQSHLERVRSART